jgi:hypothetical protein
MESLVDPDAPTEITPVDGVSNTEVPDNFDEKLEKDISLPEIESPTKNGSQTQKDLPDVITMRDIVAYNYASNSLKGEEFK